MKEINRQGGLNEKIYHINDWDLGNNGRRVERKYFK